jgi:hypothetical protein
VEPIFEIDIVIKFLENHIGVEKSKLDRSKYEQKALKSIGLYAFLQITVGDLTVFLKY